jgi:serine/threonine protein phosphatase PrpC
MKSNNRSSFSAVGSTTYRQNSLENQDYTGIVLNLNLGVRAVIVADGLGSQAYAGLGACWAVESAIGLIQAADKLTEQVLQDMFVAIRASVKTRAESFLVQQGLSVDKNQSFGTTLIIVIEDATSFTIGYVGNGAIWHIRGGFNDFNANQYFPWNALNYLNPHTVQNEMGKEALYRMISISDDDEESIPAILKIHKDSFFGDIIMICTDGICSNDQINVGRTKDNSVWFKAEPSIIRIFTMLDNFLLSQDQATEDFLSASLDRYLSQLLLDGLLDDDASAGLIITNAVLEYQRKKNKKL